MDDRKPKDLGLTDPPLLTWLILRQIERRHNYG